MAVNQYMQAPLAPQTPKSKTTAILLAVFLTFWTWVYTYKVDSWKFWLNLVASILTAGVWAILVSWPWAIINAAIRPNEWYETFPNGDALSQQAAAQGAMATAMPTPVAPAAPAAPVAPVVQETSEVAEADGQSESADPTPPAPEKKPG